MTADELKKNGFSTIVVFGDSITLGSVTYDEMNYETVYWNRLKKKIYQVRDYVSVNIINAGICGVSATTSVRRVENHVA